MNLNESLSDEDVHERVAEFFSKNIAYRQEVENRLDLKDKRLFSLIVDAGQPMQSARLALKLGFSKSTVSRRVKRLNGPLRKFSEKYGIHPPVQVNTRYKGKNKVLLHWEDSPLETIRKNLGQLGQLEERGKKDTSRDADKRDMFEQVRQCLLEDALRALKRQLRSEDIQSYVLLKLQIGNLPEHRANMDMREASGYRFLLEHGRTWSPFDEQCLKIPGSSYVISSISGAGKTTFLRHLQQDVLDNNGLLAIYLKAKETFGIAPFSGATLIEYLCKALGGVISPDIWERVLGEAFSKQQILLLIDALDNLGEPGTNCAELAERILDKREGNSVIMAGRPSVVRWLENEQDLEFLRLTPFNVPAQKIFFGKYFEKAQVLCKRDREFLRIPMYAYLVRTLVAKGEDQAFQSRWDIYSRFVYHVLYKHRSNIQEKMHDQWVNNVRSAIGRVSYRAIDLAEPIFEAIPYEVCAKLLGRKTIPADVIPSTGIVDLLEIERSRDSPYLAFVHPTFQEFFAADWARQKDQRIDHVLDQVRSPKWREVIKFLAGCFGESFVKRIYCPGDSNDADHSRLFLATECCAEVGSTNMQQCLCEELIEVLHSPLKQIFPTTYYDQICNLMQSGEKWIRIFALEMFGLRAFLPDENQMNDRHIDQICDLLDGEDRDVRGYAFGALACVTKKMRRRHVERVVGFLGGEDIVMQKTALSVLMSIRDNRLIEPQDVDQLVSLFNYADLEIAWMAADTIRWRVQLGLKLLPYQIERIISFLVRDYVGPDAQEIALYVLGGVIDKPSDRDLETFVVILRSGFARAERTALRTIQELASKLTPPQIRYIIHAGLECVLRSSDETVRETAFQTFQILTAELKKRKADGTH